MVEKPVILAIAPDKPGALDGPSSWIKRLVPALITRGLDMRVAICPEDTNERGELEKAFERLNVPCRRIEGPIGPQARGILELVGEWNVSAVISNHSLSGHYAGKVLRESGIVSVMVAHSDERPYWRAFDLFAAERQGRAVDCVVPVSKHLEEGFLARAEPGLRIERIPYGAPRPELRTGREPGPLRLLYCGRLVTEQKRILDVARAFVMACEALENVEAVFVGDGPQREDAKAIVAKSSVAGRIRFMGQQSSDDIQRIMADSHVIVLLSDYEGLPISLMEAMATGLVPVVSPMASGINELVVDGVTGCVVRDREVAFVETVRRLRDDIELWGTLSNGAFEKFEALFDQEKAFDHWAALLRELATRGSGQIPGTAVEFPRTHWTQPWSHPSMGCGAGRLPFAMAWLGWQTWGKIPYSIRRLIKKGLGS